ncbi:Sin4p NDAI_0F03870 [Naumovozyma dairenensis CBS 421]|uniref:Mediator of RNA polymerase II transcription subunit 16 n=1 Tax=Naumovozyma dairenensis (strain ATCC 10597 / BCRC 20456 / CBS 421 / NBRC 0211 / NRRL Y-12639) TaxID=1071378 RepID=G0WD44_NAUDC|nr:hypothetical protein NDAI_0F03870 [Naumovozyma dairenensis CBS 421]CCD25705.1 hypothetical protein NDAI_0F03870 [Naumovozyma dairenensis CBS 421]
MSLIGQHPVSWSKNGVIAYADPHSPDANLRITFLETINGINWRFHPPTKYILHPQLHEPQFSHSYTLNTAPSASEHSNSMTSSTIGLHPTPTRTVTTANTTTVSSIPPSAGTSVHSKGNPQFFYSITGVYWNNWLSLPGDMLAVCDELGNLTMMIAGQQPNGANTFERLTMLFQDNVYKIYNHVMSLKPSTSIPLITEKFERKHTKKEYNTTIMDFEWLSATKITMAAKFCALDTTSNTYKNKLQQIPPYGVFHPAFMKYACLGIRKNGQINFWYQFSNSKDHKKITLQLHTSVNQRTKELDWLTFAKITPIVEDQCMLISTYSKLTNKLIFYELHVNWNVNATKPTALNDPTVKIQQILETTIDPVDNEGNPLKLSNIHIMSKTPTENDPSPEILLVYDIMGSRKTLVKRYKLVRTQLPLDFVSILKSENNSGGGQYLRSNRYNFIHQVDLPLEKRVKQVTTELINGFITFYFEDGTTIVYNQGDWKVETERLLNQPLSGNYNNLVTSMLSVNFQFPKLPNLSAIEWVRVSPSLTGIIAKIANKSTPQYFPLMKHDVTDTSKDDLNATAFAFAYVIGTYRQLSAEDLTITCKTHLMQIAKLDENRAKNFVMLIVARIYTFLNVSLDPPKEIMDKFLTGRQFQRITLFQLELGTCFDGSNLDEMARLLLNLKSAHFAFNGVSRNLHFAIEQINTTNAAQQLASGKTFQTVFSKQDLIYSLIPIAKWFVKFITYMIQELLILINNPPNKENTLVIGVFGSKVSRMLILLILVEIKKIVQIITKFPENTYPVLNESSYYLRTVLSDSPVNFEKFETFLVDVNNKFSAYNEQQQKLNPQSQSTQMLRECSLLVRAEVLPEFSKIGEFLLAYSNNVLISHVDAARVYFCDTSGLRISSTELFRPEYCKLLQPLEKGLVIDPDDNPILPLNPGRFSPMVYDGISYDRFTKQEVSEEKIKRCARCGCVTRAGYVVSNDKTITSTIITTKRWPSMYTRNCTCSGMLYELRI